MCIFHKWSEWSELVDVTNGVAQYKYCKKCNKINRRRLNNDYDANFNLNKWNHKQNQEETNGEGG